MQSLIIESKSNKPSLHVINTQHDESFQSVKVIDLIRRRTDTGERFYAIEVSHSDNLLLDFNEFTVQPLFTSVTWFIKDNVKAENDVVNPAVPLINAITSTPTLLHLACYQLTEMTLDKLLKMKFTNFLALRGDTVDKSQLLQNAIDLVKIIKHKSRNTSLAVGGYPDLHPESLTESSDVKYLKEKVDAGADFIITQLCFSSTQIRQFIVKCREAGISVPIVPGIFIPSNYGTLKFICRLCKITVPEEVFRMYKQLKDDQNAFQDYAVGNTVELLTDLFENDEDPVVGVQFFTLNNFELVKRVTSKFDFK